MEENDYVRTKDGEILKIDSFEKDCLNIDCVCFTTGEIYTEELLKEILTKHSKNIIDLIEVGDIVNGYIVLDVMEDLQTGEIHLEMPSSYPKEGSCAIYNDDIKTILTHEQYNSNCYKVKGE